MNAAPMRIAPGEEEDDNFNKALGKAVDEMNGPKEEPKQEPPVTNLDLMKRSRQTLATNVQSLQSRVSSIQEQIADAVQRRDDQIDAIHEQHRLWMLNAKAELHQIVRVQAALGLAIDGLSKE